MIKHNGHFATFALLLITAGLHASASFTGTPYGGLLFSSQVNSALSVGESGEKTPQVAITANLKYGARGELRLAYDDSLVATLAIYGSRPKTISWDVSHRFLDCADFEAIKQHLSVYADGQPQIVLSFICTAESEN